MSSTTGGEGGPNSAHDQEDKKPNDQSAHIILKVKALDGNEVFFRIKRSTQLKKLMYAYCDRQSVDTDSFAFMFDGRRLLACQTPDELFDCFDHIWGMEDVHFNIKRNTELKKLLNAYCQHQSVPMDSFRFTFDERRIRGEHTPAELEMEDGDEIDAWLEQTARGKSNSNRNAEKYQI